MNRDEKAAAIAELTDDLKGADAVFAVDYRGISVTDAAELRSKLRDADATFKVVKNRLAKRATADAGTEAIDDLLVGPTALTLIKGDAVIAAKTIADFAKEHEELEYKGGLMDGEALDPEGFQAIARLPGVDVLRGQLVGMAASPLTGLVAGLGNMISGLGRQLSQMAEQGLVTGEAPAAEEPAEEAPAAEATDTSEETSSDEAPEETDTAESEEAPAAETDDDTSEEGEAEGNTSEDAEEDE
ncbi:MAG TPA: 50S ribosomal protein L10 [Solirubrobacterales bacterium]|nr:50S ribosomal protein L10 [Solirubrobacterales bacterium]